jgi:hypothetical protein
MSAYYIVAPFGIALAYLGIGIVFLRKSHNNSKKFITDCFKKVGINF